jgi:hypothetical protein
MGMGCAVLVCSEQTSTAIHRIGRSDTVTNENIPHPGQNAPWEEHLKTRIASAQEESRDWWKVLGEDTPLRQAVDEKASQLQRVGAVPLEPPVWPFLVPSDVPERVRAVSAWLLRKFPRLTTYSPEIKDFILQRSLEAALCTNWDRACETLDYQIERWYIAHDLYTRAEVWHVRWEPNEQPPPDTFVLPPEQTHPVLLDPLYRDPVPVRVNTVLPVVLVPWWPEQSYDEFHNAAERGRAEAAQWLAGRKPQALAGRAPGRPRQYHAMRYYYRRWLDAGAPGTPEEPGRVPGVTGDGRRYLKAGIRWLHPENVEDFALED